MKTYLLSLCILGCSVALSSAEDWPSWLGEKMDATWREQGITQDFEANAPNKLWSVPAGLGYSGPTVADGKVFITDYVKESGTLNNNPGGKDRLTGQERVRALSLETGQEIWSVSYDQPYFLSYAGGPRAVPTYAEGKLYVLGAEGKLHCLNAEDGEVIWSKDFKEDYGAETPIWGHSAHPLVHGDHVYCMVGGSGSVVVAFHKETGEEAWKALDATEIGYCPPSIIEEAGVEQLIVWHSDALNALNPETGEVYWSVDHKPNYGMSIMAPRKAGNYLFASGIGRVGALLELSTDKPGAEVAWRSKPKEGVYCANSTPFILGDTIYGCDVDTSNLIAVDLVTAERLWETPEPTIGADGRGRHGTAFLTFHEPSGKFFLFNERGHLILAELSAEGYLELGRVPLLKPTNEAFGRPVVWTAPAFAEKSIIVRNDEEIIRVDLSAN